MKPEKNENNKKAVDRRSALKLGATAALGGALFASVSSYDDAARGEVYAPKSAARYEIYFLRSLHKIGKLNEKRLSMLIKAGKLEANPKELMAVIADASGREVPRKLAGSLATLASVIVQSN